MQVLIKVLIILSAVALIAGGVAVFVTGGRLMNFPPESFSRASSNFALIAIALSVCNWNTTKFAG